jgi:hypothetical protein
MSEPEPKPNEKPNEKSGVPEFSINMVMGNNIYLRSVPNDDGTIEIREVKEHEDDEGDVHESFVVLDILPSKMAYAIDPLSGDRRYIALNENDDIVADAPDYDGFIGKLKQHPKYAIVSNKVQYYKRYLPTVYYPLYPGVYDDGFHDPYGLIDEEDYGVEPLVKAVEWARGFFDEPNDRHAAFLILAAVGKVLTPIVRYHNGTFIDQLVWVHGRGGVGKTTVVNYINRPLLGVPLGINEVANLRYHIVLTLTHFSTPNQLRNLLDENYLPLIIDEQQGIRITELLSPIIAGTIGIGLTGVHAAKYGQGIGAQFTARRGWVLVTNVSFNDYVRRVLNLNATDEMAVRRRVVADEWAPIILTPDDWVERARRSPIPVIMPIYGFMGRLWVKHKKMLMDSGTFLILLRNILDAIRMEYANDARVKGVVEYLHDVVDKVEGEVKVTLVVETPEEAFVRMAIEFARRHGFTPANRITALYAILTVPGAVFPHAPRGDRLLELKEEASKAIDELRQVAPNSDPNVGKIFEIVEGLISEGKPVVIVPKDGPVGVIHGSKFLGERANTYMVNGKRITGYPVPIHHLVELFLESPIAEPEESKTGEGGGEPGSGEANASEAKPSEEPKSSEVGQSGASEGGGVESSTGEVKPSDEGSQAGEAKVEVKGGKAQEGAQVAPQEGIKDFVEGIVEVVKARLWARWPGVELGEVVGSIVSYIAESEGEVSLVDIERRFYDDIVGLAKSAGIKDDEVPKLVSDVVMTTIEVLKEKGGLE